MNGGAITLKGISKRWGDTLALDGIDIEVPAGSFTALLGPSGCGKSTLLRIVSGLEEASSGRVGIAGQDVTQRPADKRDLSMVFQSYALFPHLSVAENIIFGLRTGWFTPTELGAIAAIYAFAVGLVIYRGIGLGDTYGLLRESAHTTASVLFIVASASVFSMILALEQIPQQIVGALLVISDNPHVVLLIIMLGLLALGTVLEGLALLVILAPLLLEVTSLLGIDPVHFGVLLVLNTTIGSLTPPVGTVLYTVCAITRCSVEEYTREALPFLAALVAVLLLLAVFPPLVTALPNLLF